MTEQELHDLLKPYMDPKYDGTFNRNEFDLDVDVHNDWKTFALFVGGPEWDGEVVRIDLPVTLENADLIQKVVRSFGRELLHTWNMKYNADPRAGEKPANA